MELAALGSDSVLRDADVVSSREKARQDRLRRLLIALVVVAVPVVGRTAAGIVRYLQGNYMAAAGDFRWPHPGIPASLLPYLPGLILIVLLAGYGRPAAHGRSFAARAVPPRRARDDAGRRRWRGGRCRRSRQDSQPFPGPPHFRRAHGRYPPPGSAVRGPPGTGKTYIAKAMAAEAGVPFLFVSSSAFQSMYYGQTNRKIRSYFRALHNYARREGGAIGFIEEIDAIGAARGGLGGGPGREGVAGVVNELLIQLQSFDVPPFSTRAVNTFIDAANRWLPPAHALRKRVMKPANFLVIGATNRAADLDPALLRPGRFDRTIRVDVPSRTGRRDIIDYYLARKAHDAGLDDPAKRDAMAGSTFGYSPVMLEHLLDEALGLGYSWRAGPDELGRCPAPA